MTIRTSSSLTDVGFAVCTALDATGTIAVMTGASAAAYYSTRYQSLDVDFVLHFVPVHALPERVVIALGFVRKGQQYVHPSSKYTLDFPLGLLAIGRELITRYESERRGSQKLHVLSRTDSVRDRLAAFYHWNDRSSLESAVLVALSGRSI